jgi:hypothetical protein
MDKSKINQFDKATKHLRIFMIAFGLLLVFVAALTCYASIRVQETKLNIKRQVKVECQGKVFLVEVEGDPCFRDSYQETWFCVKENQPAFEITKGYKNK